jgi:hypothetical protein
MYAQVGFGDYDHTGYALRAKPMEPFANDGGACDARRFHQSVSDGLHIIEYCMTAIIQLYDVMSAEWILQCYLLLITHITCRMTTNFKTLSNDSFDDALAYLSSFFLQIKKKLGRIFFLDSPKGVFSLTQVCSLDFEKSLS